MNPFEPPVGDSAARLRKRPPARRLFLGWFQIVGGLGLLVWAVVVATGRAPTKSPTFTTLVCVFCGGGALFHGYRALRGEKRRRSR